MWTRLLITGFLLFVAACGTAEDSARDVVAADPVPTTDGPTAHLLAGVDISRHEVPLADVHFDTFDGGSISLAEASGADVSRLLDAIPPIDRPRYEDGAEVTWLADDDLVIGFVDSQGGPWAFPHRILNFHEIVNDEYGGVPVAITFCPLCQSSLVFDRRFEGEVLSFGNTSALHQNAMVMVDRETSSYWWQPAGRSIVGTLTGGELTLLSSVTATWGEWLELNPSTQVLSRDTGFGRDYDRDPFIGYPEAVNRGRVPFPVDQQHLEDGRLEAGALVVVVETTRSAKAYPIDDLRGRTVEDDVGATTVRVEVTDRGAALVTDVASGAPIPTRTLLWFSAVSTAPGLDLWSG